MLFIQLSCSCLLSLNTVLLSMYLQVTSHLYHVGHVGFVLVLYWNCGKWLITTHYIIRWLSYALCNLISIVPILQLLCDYLDAVMSCGICWVLCKKCKSCSILWCLPLIVVCGMQAKGSVL